MRYTPKAVIDIRKDIGMTLCWWMHSVQHIAVIKKSKQKGDSRMCASFGASADRTRKMPGFNIRHIQFTRPQNSR